MTDDKSVEATEAQAEEAQASDDVDLEDMEVSFDDQADESSADEPAESTEEDDAEESEAEDSQEPESPDEPEQSDSEETEDTAGDDTPPDPVEAEKLWKQEMYQRRQAEKQLKEERQKQEKANLDRYLQEAGDDEFELNRRQLEVSAHLLKQEQVSLVNEKLKVGVDRAIADIDLFKTGTPEMKEEMAKSLEDFERMYVRKDDQGNFVQVDADVYQYLQDKAESLKRIAGIGARQQVKQKANEKARTVTRPVMTPKPPKADPDIDGFDEEANRW
jgi:hypothetical protein